MKNLEYSELEPTKPPLPTIEGVEGPDYYGSFVLKHSNNNTITCGPSMEQEIIYQEIEDAKLFQRNNKP